MPYSENTSEDVRNGEGYSRIPLNEMDFDKEHLDLVRESIRFLSGLSLKLAGKVKRTEMPSKEQDPKRYIGTLAQFRRFPEELFDRSLESGHYSIK